MSFAAEGIDRAGGDAAVQRQFDHVIGGQRQDCRLRLRGKGRRDDRSLRRQLYKPLGQLQHFQRAGAIGEAADEPAFLQRADQAVNARLRLEVERLLHLLKARRYATQFEMLLDEQKQLLLLGGEHRLSSLPMERTENI